MSQHTVCKMRVLKERQLIRIEEPTVTTGDTLKRNGNLFYTIPPIQLALDQFYRRQMARMDLEIERQRVAKALALRSDKEHSA